MCVSEGWGALRWHLHTEFVLHAPSFTISYNLHLAVIIRAQHALENSLSEGWVRPPLIVSYIHIYYVYMCIFV